MKLLQSLIYACLTILFTTQLAIAAEKYTIDPNHTNITWKAGHLGFSFPSGKFTKTEGVLHLDQKNLEKSKIEVTIHTASILTGIEKFDTHLKSADFFNSSKHKLAAFTSTKIVMSSKTSGKIHGNLTLNGVTKPVILNATLNKVGPNPFTKAQTAGFSATATIKRSEFKIKYGLPAISDDVNLDIELEAILAK